MLVSTGNINQPYTVIGTVHAMAAKTPESTGCGGAGGLPVQATYEAVTKSLADAAAASGGDGVINIGYDYRMAQTTVGCNSVQPMFEVYGWGTAIKLG